MEFQVDLCSSYEEATAFMKTGFDSNPVGVEYDPDELLASYRAGTPEKKLLAFYNGGPVSPIRGSISTMM